MAADELIDGRRKGNATKHGFSGTRIYRIWKNMIQRTKDENSTNFKKYKERNGGVSIPINPEWLKFENFLSDMGEDKGYSLDRINNDLGYSKENCRWVTRGIQSLNRRPFGILKSQGVILRPNNKYQASLNFNKKRFHIGTFETLESATRAYQEKRRELYGC